MKKETSYGGFILLVLATGLIIYLGFLLINQSNKSNSAMDDFCKEKGYEKKTDYKTNNNLYDFNSIQIECDGVVVGSAILRRPCIKYDKWGDCIKEGIEIN